MHIAYPLEGKIYYVRTPLGVAQVTCTARVWQTVGRHKRLYVSLAELPGALLPYEVLTSTWDYSYESEVAEGTESLPVIERADALYTDDYWYQRRLQGIPNV